MVQWKDNLNGEVGEKAHNLEELEEKFNVPNFFVITPEEVRELFKDVKGKDQVLNSQVKGEIRNKIKDAYQDVGVSSEVRNAVGKAKTLVGGQRNNSLVSIRVSDRGSGEYEHELNVGSSNLFKAIKKVASSYYEKNEDQPAIIVQKMVEPEYTGAVITDYSRNGLVEIVDGLGTPLEDGSERPHLYLIGRQGIIEKRINDNQSRVERNPINGEKQKKSSREFEMSDEEVKKFFGEVASREINVKFAYKRGSFHVVDAWKAERDESKDIQSISGIKIGEGNFEGEVGREIKMTDKPIIPDKYRAIICKKGGYTSSKVQRARKNNKIGLFSYDGQVEDGKSVVIKDDGNLEVKSSGSGKGFPKRERNEGDKASDEINVESSGSYSFSQVVGSEILPLEPNRGDGLYTGGVFENKLKLVRKGESREVSRENVVDSYEDAFNFNKDFLVLDLREINQASAVIDYLEAEEKVMIMEDAELDFLESAVEVGFNTFISPTERIERVRNKVAKAEKRFIINQLRNLDS